MSPAIRSHHNAFTLIELLIVISIFVLLLTIAVPAFSSMLYSSEQSMAENALRIGMSSARDAAVRGGPGHDACAVFIYENQRMGIMPCVRAGTIEDADPAFGNNDLTHWITREIFTPIPGFEPVRMPKGWMVRGYAPPGTIDAQAGAGTPGLWYEPTTGRQFDQTKANWVFPETQFYNDQDGDQGSNRQTFMVRFEGGTGMLKIDPTASLVLYPSEWTSFRGATPWNKYNANDESDGAKFVARVKAAPPPASGITSPPPLDLVARRQLLGDASSDTILVKGVGQLAVYNEKKLASALSAMVGQSIRLDDTSGCLYVHEDEQFQTPGKPTYVANVPTNDNARINSWIQGQGTDLSGSPVDSDCRIFVVQRYLGWLQEVTGTINGQGVSQ